LPAANTNHEKSPLLTGTIKTKPRSYGRQGIDQVPTVHLGVAAHQMEKRGIRTERGDMNREVAVTNSQIRQLKARIKKLRDWVQAEDLKTTEPDLQDIFATILNGGENRAYWRINKSLKGASQLLIFLQKHSIYTVEDLRGVVTNMYAQQGQITDKLKKAERRIETLDRHIKNGEILGEYSGHVKQYRKLYSQYETLRDSTGFGAKRKAQKALDVAESYRESQRAPITLYEAAERYMKAALNGKTTRAPLNEWKAERAKLGGEKNALYKEYYTLKDEVAQVEKMRRHIEDIAREESRERQPHRAQENGL
jgi:chromosome segregation ATPase